MSSDAARMDTTTPTTSKGLQMELRDTPTTNIPGLCNGVPALEDLTGMPIRTKQTNGYIEAKANQNFLSQTSMPLLSGSIHRTTPVNGFQIGNRGAIPIISSDLSVKDMASKQPYFTVLLNSKKYIAMANSMDQYKLQLSFLPTTRMAE